MTLNEFTQALIAKHPQAAVARSKEVGGVSRQAGLTITFTPNGKMLSYTGSYYSIAQELDLIEKWYVLENGSVVEQATSKTEANEKLVVKQNEAVRLVEVWGGQVGEFTIRKVN